jgi:hypothetical protein
MVRFRIACAVGTVGVALTIFASGAAQSATRASENPVAASIAKTLLAGSAAFNARGHLTVPEQTTYLVLASGELGMSGARMYLAASERGHGATRAHIRLVFNSAGPVFYLYVPRLAGELPQGKTWVRATTNDLLKLTGVDPSTLSGLGTALNPSSLLMLLGSITTSPERVGPTMIGGHLTERYHLLISPAALAKQPGLPAELQGVMGDLNPVSLDAWIDQNDGYLRQLQIAYLAKGPTPPHFVVTVQLHDFGTPVHVAAPPASATISVAELPAALQA